MTDYEEDVIGFDVMRTKLVEAEVKHKTLKDAFFDIYPETEG